ncbi:MAG: efflux RND transporter periplasmic adaptor subunit [Gammaproteobacteria bacterium]|nr:efflux RND transporter periplasmic adaptor subunit [Gammaproteobacteria bacterium]NNF49353.1 efflux RND transporter periplasmic adaptor subunit [Woeseiaceae bacterium]MBT8093574.1 efflux RND transporter periplasmic adaptor subunit [Gammaproteobacteria bacterium]MBT8106462.1 efflux RND transporter periplasmic adaptor subunit [Gammaproteobacteria bacterium]NNK26477.1 efflux RND transporter periplasmic adaptor subunit [Woeseiaceae bacterium]
MRAATATTSVLALAAAAHLAGCGVGEASVAADAAGAEPVAAVPVEVARPYRADIHATYQATATITTDADAPVVARAAGEVVKIHVEEGAVVNEGDVLATLDGERLRLEMLAALANLRQAQAEYERNVDLAARGLISAAAFDNLHYDLEALEATYELRRLMYGYSKIRAPIAGIVAVREIKPGQHLAVNDIAFRITDPSELIAHLQVPQAELAKFAAGQKAAVEVAAMPGQGFPARIERISPTIDTRNGTFRATAIIDNASGELAPGMFGRFTIAWEEHERALVISAAALIGEDEESAVYVVNNEQVERRTVEVGIETDGMVEILGGLDEQDIVVVVGHSGLRDGSKVLASNDVPGSFTG